MHVCLWNVFEIATTAKSFSNKIFTASLFWSKQDQSYNFYFKSSILHTPQKMKRSTRKNGTCSTFNDLPFVARFENRLCRCYRCIPMSYSHSCCKPCQLLEATTHYLTWSSYACGNDGTWQPVEYDHLPWHSHVFHLLSLVAMIIGEKGWFHQSTAEICWNWKWYTWKVDVTVTVHYQQHVIDTHTWRLETYPVIMVQGPGDNNSS